MAPPYSRKTISNTWRARSSACATANRSVLEHQSDIALNVARAALDRAGGVTFDPKRKVAWNAVNQFTNGSVSVELPALTIGEWVAEPDPPADKPAVVVDETQSVTGATATIFQRMNEDGDMLRVITNVLSKDGQRAVGTFIPRRNADGSPNPVIETILRKERYRGRAFVVDRWYSTSYEAITNSDGAVVGMLYSGLPERLATDQVRRVVMETKVATTGHIFVMNAKGADRGRYVISERGEDDGEDMWDSRDASGKQWVREICERAQSLGPAERAVYRYTAGVPPVRAPRS